MSHLNRTCVMLHRTVGGMAPLISVGFQSSLKTEDRVVERKPDNVTSRKCGLRKSPVQAVPERGPVRYDRLSTYPTMATPL